MLIGKLGKTTEMFQARLKSLLEWINFIANLGSPASKQLHDNFKLTVIDRAYKEPETVE